jgi:diguanylate cyclase (GGDEF)-like protein
MFGNRRVSAVGFLAGVIAGGTLAAALDVHLLATAHRTSSGPTGLRHISSVVWLVALTALLVSHVRLVRVIRNARTSARRATAISECDDLTSLANRRALGLRVAQIQQQARTNTCAVLVMDLDCFKSVNDILGHAAGDLVLQRVSDRIRQACGPEAQAFRLGGDEFAVLVDSLHDLAAVDTLVRAIAVSVARPIEGNGWRVAMGCSIGQSVGPASLGLDALLLAADRNMYQHKTANHARGPSTAIAKRTLRPHPVFCSLQDQDMRLLA